MEGICASQTREVYEWEDLYVGTIGEDTEAWALNVSVMLPPLGQ